MLVVVAHRHDQAARRLVARWEAHDARLLTCDDLSVRGWWFDPGAPVASQAVTGGRVIRGDEITGVLTRLPCVEEWELDQIAPADRSYVAAEMNAFLLAWLSALPCVVLNRPVPPLLSGPNWRREHWVHAAAHLGIPVHQVRRRVARGGRSTRETPPSGTITVTVVGGRLVGTDHAPLAHRALHLARAGGVDLLEATFASDDSAFLDADLWPDPTGDGVADALLECFLERVPVAARR